MVLLHAKLRIPAARRELVARPRLLGQLPVSTDGMPPIVLVSAPAGFGKTTILAQWLALAAERGLRTAWLSLDASDSDPEHFVAHLAAALGTVAPGVGADLAGAARAGAEAASESALVGLINDLDLLAEATVLVLDDYHLVEGDRTHALLRTLAENLPVRLTLAIATREDPPLPLARLRANGDLVELRAADLRFTPIEAERLLHDVAGPDLDAASVAAIETRTEGWAAGLQLAGIAVRGHRTEDDVETFVHDFTRSDRFVIDYLLDEVLAGLTDRLRDFLIATSILEELSGGLCDALTGAQDGRDALAELERSGLFVVALDDRREWYRYHHLFATALRAQLHAGATERVTALHRAAAGWLAAHGMPLDALPHADAAGDGELVAELLELALPELRRDREDATIRHWLDRVPEAALRARRMLSTAAAWASLSRGDLEHVTPWLDAADAAGDPASLVLTSPPADLVRAHEAERSELPAMIEVYRATVTQARGDVGSTRAHAERAYALAPPDRHLARAAAAGYLGLAAWADGDLGVATDAFADAIGSMRAAGNLADALGATVVIAEMWRARGRPDRAERSVRAALAEAERADAGTLTSAGDLHTALAALLVERGALAEADEQVRLAHLLGDAASFPENHHRRHLVEAGVLRAREELTAASDALERAEARYLPGFLPDLQPMAARRARLRIAQGDLDAAGDWALRDGSTLDDAGFDGTAFARSYRVLTRIRLLLARRRAGESVDLEPAAARLEQLATSAEDRGQGELATEARILLALLLDARGDRRAARSALERALPAVDQGFGRLFLDETPAILPLLDAVASGSTASRGRAAALLRLRADARSAPTVVRADDAGASEALSARERDVLRLLASDLTGPQIAAQLYVTVNTLRTHTKHIFTKLDVNSRRAAVRTAAERGLL